jgi:hypothetical protein
MKNKDQIFLEEAYELICEKKKKNKIKKKSIKNIPQNALYGGGYAYWGGGLGYGEIGSGGGGDSGGGGE